MVVTSVESAVQSPKNRIGFSIDSIVGTKSTDIEMKTTKLNESELNKTECTDSEETFRRASLSPDSGTSQSGETSPLPSPSSLSSGQLVNSLGHHQIPIHDPSLFRPMPMMQAQPPLSPVATPATHLPGYSMFAASPNPAQQNYLMAAAAAMRRQVAIDHTMQRFSPYGMPPHMMGMNGRQGYPLNPWFMERHGGRFFPPGFPAFAGTLNFS